MSQVCSECGAANAREVDQVDVEHLGNESQIRVPLSGGGLAHAIFIPLGIAIAKSVTRKYFENLAFCEQCRRASVAGKDPFLAANVLSGIGFMTFFLFVFAPIGWLFFIAAAVVLRIRLRAFRKQPKAQYVPYAIQAIGIFLIAILAHTAIMVVYGFVYYQLTLDPGFRRRH